MTESHRSPPLGFEDFRRLAQDPSLSKYERIDFPDSYREGHEPAIFADIRRKLTLLDGHARNVLDIGPGCSDLPRLLIDHCTRMGHELHLVDSAEMLALLPDGDAVRKHPGRHPDVADVVQRRGAFDVVLSYSVLQYVFVDMPLNRFLDASLALLAPGGQLLLGDIPNVSKRRRFFASDAGKAFHKAFMQTSDDPVVESDRVEPHQIDDAVIMFVVQRARSAGFDAYVLPQDPALPMANRREDILIVRP